jgi:hypothetical protein
MCNIGGLHAQYPPMATPKPGEIRCPTCHRSTAPAAFCTQCGSPIPADARARPRGLDRDELQERVRLRRPTEEPYRRGAVPRAAAASTASAYEAFTPEPEDQAVIRPADEPSVARVDHYRDEAPPVDAPSVEPALRRGQLVSEEEEPLVAPLPPSSWDSPPPVRDEAPPYVEPGYAERDEPEHVDYYDDAAYAGEDPYAYAYEADLDQPRGSSGAGVLAVVGLLVLGVVALFGGALLAGIFNGDRGIGGLTPTPSATASAEPTVAPTAPSVAPTSSAAGPSSTPQASDGSVAFPDGFEAKAAPCKFGAAELSGCTASGETNNGDVWIWVGFRNGSASDALNAALKTAAGDPIGEGNVDLGAIGCTRAPTCNGWTRFGFENLKPGKYIVRVTRNGDPAARTSFEVKG